MKLYARVNENYDGLVFPLYCYKEEMDDCNIESMILELQKIDRKGEMFCTFYNDFGCECGRECAEYLPRNGVSGRCRCLVNGYVGTGEYFELKKGNKRLVRMKKADINV